MTKHIKILEQFRQEENIKTDNFNINLNNHKYKITHLKTQANKKTIIFIHSFRTDKYSLLIELYIKFLKQGYSIVIFDLPAHGENKNKFSLKTSSELLSKIITHLKTKKNIKKEDLILIGQSMGGFLALLESTKQTISGIITIAALHKIERKPLSSYLELLLAFSPGFLRQFKYYSPKHIFSLNILNNKLYSKEEIKSMTQEAHQVSDKILEKINHSNANLLQIHGKLDLLVPFSQAKNIKQNYTNKNTEHIFPSYSSHLNIMFNKKIINKILNWLDKQTS